MLSDPRFALRLHSFCGSVAFIYEIPRCFLVCVARSSNMLYTNMLLSLPVRPQFLQKSSVHTWTSLYAVALAFLASGGRLHTLTLPGDPILNAPPI